MKLNLKPFSRQFNSIHLSLTKRKTSPSSRQQKLKAASSERDAERSLILCFLPFFFCFFGENISLETGAEKRILGCAVRP
jgi:hypothetical protein